MGGTYSAHIFRPVMHESEKEPTLPLFAKHSHFYLI